MIGDCHVRFLGEGRRATYKPYPTSRGNWAQVLEPENLLYGAMILEEMKKWADYLDTILPQPHPLIGSVPPPKRRYPAKIIPLNIEQKMLSLEVIQNVLEAPEHQHWWQLLRQSTAENWPEGVPKRIVVRLS